MAKPTVKGAPQLSRLLRELPPELMKDTLAADVFCALAQMKEALAALNRPERSDVETVLADLDADDIAFLEREALRIVRLNAAQADAIHLRLAEGPGFECQSELEDKPGALARAAWSFVHRPLLFRHVERAMQMRSYREHRQYYDGHELQSPVPLRLEHFQPEDFASTLAERLELKDGCSVEAVELPAGENQLREVMIAVVTGGALQSARTFEADRQEGVIQYRPATELILVYKPELGQIEVCGRGWTDRRAIVTHFARKVLNEDVSERPLIQRNYDLSPFRQSLEIEVPEGLQDRILSSHVTEARYALGSYDRKITVSALAGEPIQTIAGDMLRGVGTKSGRPFLCDIELLLRISPGDGRERTLRISVSNRNRSTLQSETDPESRAIGFALLKELGVVTNFEEPPIAEARELLPSLIKLLAQTGDTIGLTELRELGADERRLTKAGFLIKRRIAATVLIDDDDIGPLEASAQAELSTAKAVLSLDEDEGVLMEREIDPLLSWTIQRDYVREKVLERLLALNILRRPVDRGHGLYYLGHGEIGRERRPLYLWEGSTDLRALEKVDRTLRDAGDRVAGIVLTAGPKPLSLIGKYLVLELGELIDSTTAELDIAVLLRRWTEGRSPAEAGEGVDFENRGDRATLRLPGKEPWTIVGAKRVRIVEKLYQAYLDGSGSVKTSALLAHTGSANLRGAFSSAWKVQIEARYIFSPRRGYWALAIE